MAKRTPGDPSRYTDINIGYSVDTEDQRTKKEIDRDLEKAGTKVINLSEKPPEAF